MTYETRTYVKNGHPQQEAVTPEQAVALEFDGFALVTEAPVQSEEEAALAAAEAERLEADTKALLAAEAAAANAPKTENDGKPSDKVPSPADVAKTADKNKD